MMAFVLVILFLFLTQNIHGYNIFVYSKYNRKKTVFKIYVYQTFHKKTYTQTRLVKWPNDDEV